MLTGANVRQKESKPGATGEDGWLTAQEVLLSDLRGTELVVLSACDSGLGQVNTGDGIYGLRRAFLLAGAHTIR